MAPIISQRSARCLLAAEGWVELKNPAEALLELESIPECERELPIVLEMFYRTYACWEKWKPAHEVACRLVDRFPGESQGWIYRAYAMRRIQGGSVAAAFDALLPAFDYFPSEPVIPYNLACYCSQMSRIREAREWLEKAFCLGDRKVLLKMALADPDLEPLSRLGFLP